MLALDAAVIGKDFGVPNDNKLLAVGTDEDKLFIFQRLHLLPLYLDQRLKLVSQAEIIERRPTTPTLRE